MKKKIKIFLSERKDLLLFIGVLLVILATILTVANLSDSSENEFVLIPSDDSEVVNPQIEEKEKLTLPIEEEYIIVKEFFDLNEPSTLENAIFNLGNQMIESTGVSYAASDNTIFDVHAALSGKVIDVNSNNLEGYEVVIQHENNIKTHYLSLSEVNVKENDTVKINDVIGKAGTSVIDTLAGAHVHFQISKDNIFINPKYAYNKMVEELDSLEK